MNSPYGPWATAITTGTPQQLNTFWKRRLAMLPSLGQSTSRTTRRTVLLLGALGAAALALPTMKWVTQGPIPGSVVLIAGDVEASDRNLETAVDRRDKSGTKAKRRDVAVDVEYLPRPSKFEEEFLAALEKPVTVEFMELGLEDCLMFLHEATKIPIWFDKVSLTEEGVALDQPVMLKFQGRLQSALHLLLNPVQLAFFPENDVMVITTATKAGENLITRTYPVRDLFQGRNPRNTQMGGGMAPANQAGDKGQTPSDANSAEKKPATSATQRV